MCFCIESVLYLAGLLSEKCDLENVTSAPARAFALEQIQKIMFGSDTPITNTAPTTAGTEWLDIAAKKQPGPQVMLCGIIKPLAVSNWHISCNLISVSN